LKKRAGRSREMLGYVIPPRTTKPDEGVEEIQVEDKRYLVTVE
jgi:hypothetical protein